MNKLVLATGPYDLGDLYIGDRLVRIDVTNDTALSFKAFEKVSPFLWISDSGKVGEATGWPTWSPTEPEKGYCHKWRHLTYGEALRLQLDPTDPQRSYRDPTAKNDRNWREIGHHAAHQYLNAKQERRLGYRIRNWFQTKWNEVLYALSPNG